MQFHFPPATEAKIDAILELLRRVERRQIAMAIKDIQDMKDISDIVRAVAQETSIASAAVLALQAGQQHLTDAQAQIKTLQDQLATQAVDPAQVQSILDTIATTSAQLSAAIPANTGPDATAVVGGVVGATAAVDNLPRDAAATAQPLVPAAGAAGAPGTVVEPTEAASAGLAAGPGPIETQATLVTTGTVSV